MTLTRVCMLLLALLVCGCEERLPTHKVTVYKTNGEVLREFQSYGRGFSSDTYYMFYVTKGDSLTGQQQVVVSGQIIVEPIQTQTKVEKE